MKARATIYRGIEMRSRLEADFAAFLDRASAEWEYEPVCFAGPNDQWLPDFRARMSDGPWTYFEIKPTLGQASDALDRMVVVWLTDPSAYLQAVAWIFGDWLKGVGVAPEAQPWDAPGDDLNAFKTAAGVRR
jgi:hypothetical protein